MLQALHAHRAVADGPRTDVDQHQHRLVVAEVQHEVLKLQRAVHAESDQHQRQQANRVPDPVAITANEQQP